MAPPAAASVRPSGGAHGSGGGADAAGDCGPGPEPEPGVELPTGRPAAVPGRAGSALLYNEFVVYEERRARLRYVLLVRHLFGGDAIATGGSGGAAAGGGVGR